MLDTQDRDSEGEIYMVVFQNQEWIFISQAQFDAVTRYRGPSEGPYTYRKAKRIVEARNSESDDTDTINWMHNEESGTFILIRAGGPDSEEEIRLRKQAMKLPGYHTAYHLNGKNETVEWGSDEAERTMVGFHNPSDARGAAAYLNAWVRKRPRKRLLSNTKISVVEDGPEGRLSDTETTAGMLRDLEPHVVRFLEEEELDELAYMSQKRMSRIEVTVHEPYYSTV